MMDLIKSGRITITGEFNSDSTNFNNFINAIFTDEWYYNEDLWIKCYPHYLLTQEAME
jgi:hypothetical protein